MLPPHANQFALQIASEAAVLKASHHLPTYSVFEQPIIPTVLAASSMFLMYSDRDICQLFVQGSSFLRCYYVPNSQQWLET